MTRATAVDTAVVESGSAGGTSPSELVGDRLREPALPDRDDTRRGPYTNAVLVALAFLTALFVRTVSSVGDHVVGNDESVYLTTGIRLWSGHGFTTLGGGAELHFPPGVPFVVGGVHQLLGGDPHTATLVVNVLSTTLVILPIAAIAALAAGRRAGVLAAWVAALCPATVLALSSGGSAGLFTLLVVTAVWLTVRAAGRSRREVAVHAAGVGALVGTAYLTRPEGLFFAVVLAPALVLPVLGGRHALRTAGADVWRSAAGVFAAFAVALMLVGAPYVAYLHTHADSWQLTAKSNTMSIDAWRALSGGDRTQTLAEEFALDPTGTRFRNTPREVSSVVRADPIGYLEVVGTNVGELFRISFVAAPGPYPSWTLLPWLLLPLAAYAVWRRRHDRVVLTTVAAIAVPIVAALSYFVLDRYLIPSFTLACVLVAVGVSALPRRWRTLTTAVTLVLLASSVAVMLHSDGGGWFHPGHPNPDNRIVGEWVGRHSEPGDRIVSTSPVVGYYARREVIPTPYADEARVLAFARHNGARYLVVSGKYTRQYRPALVRLLGTRAWPGLRAVYRRPAGRTRNVVYELVPRPARHRGPVPLFDTIG